MNFIDMHIHLQDYDQQFATDMVKKAQKSGLKKMICAGTAPQDWKKVADWRNQYPDLVIPAFGIHPWKAAQAEKGFIDVLRAYLQNFSTALVGEIGLDGLKPDIETQKKVFAEQLQLAVELKRPAVIHCVKAGDMLSDYGKLLPEKFMFHSFNGRWEQMREILRRGGYVSFGASILKNRDFAKIMKDMPADRILVESDGPYQAPVKGELSTSLLIPNLIAAIAKVRDENPEELAQKIYENSLVFTATD